MARPKKLKVVTSDPKNFQRQHKGDAGFDLRLQQDVTLIPGQVSELIGTGVRVQIPENCVGLVMPRSSLGKRGITLANNVGVIDSGYRGEIKIMLVSYGKQQTLFAGERVAQLLIVPLQPVEVEFVDELEESDRGVGGFGSTGKF